MNLAALHEQIAAVCPIHGVNSDKVISFKAEATPEQRAAGQAVADSADLSRDAKAECWERIKAHRDALSDRGGYKVAVGGVDKWFHSDERSKIQQLGLVMAGASVPAVQWKTMDGSFVTMSQTLASQIYQAAMAQDSAIFQAAETHRVAMEAAANPDAYDFSGGWPATFGG